MIVKDKKWKKHFIILAVSVFPIALQKLIKKTVKLLNDTVQ